VHPCTTTCPTASDPASLLRQALALPRAPRLRTPHPCSGGLQCCHMSHGSRPRLPAHEDSGATTCRTALDPASLLGRAPVFSTCHTALGPVSLLRRAPALPRVPRLRTLPPCSRGLRRCHMSRDSHEVTCFKNK
jgi:hypothetical protein